MTNQVTRTVLLFLTGLSLAGVFISIPQIAISQSTPPANTTTTQDELAEVQRLIEQINQLQNQGQYSEAIPLAENLLATVKTMVGEEATSVANVLNLLANLYQNQGRYDQAEPLYLQTLEMRKRLLGEEHSDVAISLNNLAYLYQIQGRYTEAESLYLQALELFKRLLGDDNFAVATSLNNLAYLYQRQERYTEAEPLFSQALELFKNLLGEEHPSVATSLNNLAGLYDSQGRYTEAESLYLQALELFKRLLGDEHPSVAGSLNNLAYLYRRQGRYTEAESFYLQALEIYKRLLGEKHPSVASSLNNLAALYDSQGDINRALDFLKQGITVEEYNLALNLATGFERQKRDYLATISKTTNATISFHLKSAVNNPEAANLALTTLIQRKGRILDVFTNSLQILRQNLNPENQTLLDELSHTYSQLANLIYKTSETDTTLPLDEYRTHRSSLAAKVKQLEDQLSRRSEAFRTQSQPVTLEAIQQRIPTDAALVELVRYEPFNAEAPYSQRWGKPRYAAYILSSTGTSQAIDLGEAETIEKRIADFRQLFQDSRIPIPIVKQFARTLDTILMQPVRELIGNQRHILLSPDGALSLIPFEALVDENNRYLVETHSFTYLTSGRDLLRLQNSSPSQQPPVLIADPTFDHPSETITQQPTTTRFIDLSQRTFSSLPGTAQEAQAIAALLNVQPLTGSQATENAVKQIQSPKILHIATHGFFENNPETQPNKTTIDDNPLLLSGLVLAGFRLGETGGEDGILTALETSSLNLVGTKLVVLSACDTGLGNIHAGEGVYGLRCALVLAGSESQLISLWKVSDDATKELMVKYYQRLLDNQGRSEALRQTQLEMLGSEKYQHPYYWAAFIPSGDWTPMGR